MKGRGEIITILCMSVFLICILYAMTYGGIVKAEELENSLKRPEKKRRLILKKNYAGQKK